MSEQNVPKETSISGVGVAAGVAIGNAYILENGAQHIPEYTINYGDLTSEIQRFKDAIKKSEQQLLNLQNQVDDLPAAAAEELRFILDAHMQMVSSSRLVRGAEKVIHDELVNAEAAVQRQINSIVASFEKLPDAYMRARAEDVREVGRRLVRNLMRQDFTAFSMLPPDTILVAEELSPADTTLLNPDHVRGFVTALGGAQGHTAIMARSLSLPAILGAPGILRAVQTGDQLVIDGLTGRVIINPDPKTLIQYQERQAKILAEKQALEQYRDQPAITRDGETIALHANLELPQEVESAMRAGADGVGLLRSEFLFMNRPDLPTEEEQYRLLADVVEGMKGRVVTIRTMDIGGEKLAYALEKAIVAAPNPALGLRAIRFSLKHPDILRTQLRAILRVSVLGPIRILLPMISAANEVRQIRRLLDLLWKELQEEGVELPDKMPPLGAMIEVPAAAIAADVIAESADFFAIGTNDLTMYTLAIDRADDQVAHLYNPLHPAVIRLIAMAAKAAKGAGIPISVCGEVAGDLKIMPLLIGLGITNLSMTPSSIPTVKKRILDLDMRDLSRLGDMVMQQQDMGRIRALLDDMNSLA